MAERHFSTSIITPPASEPLTLAEARQHLRNEDQSYDDAYINLLIKAARVRAENDTGLSFQTQTFDLFLDAFPLEDPRGIVVPGSPVQSVTSITYTDTDGAEQTLDASKYRVDSKSTPARITPAYSETWPATRQETNAITVRIVAGFGIASTTIPEDLTTAIRLLLAHWYENREAVIIGTITATVPLGYDYLIAPHRIIEF